MDPKESARSNAVRDVLSLFRARSGGDDIASRRYHYDQIAAGQLLPEGVTFDSDELAGVPTERVRSPRGNESRVILFFHGGGYVGGSSRGYRAMAALGNAAMAIVLSVDYRLAPEHPFPSAVEDTSEAYRAVLARGTSATQVAFAGDSAGGGLVVSTMLKAREMGLPMPAAGYGLSPWLDLACEGESFKELVSVDPLMTADGARGCAASYLQGADAHHPWASPLYGNLSGLPPLLLQVGSTEMFLDDSTRFARVAALAGVHVEMQVWPGMPHVWQRFPSSLPDAAKALNSGGKFLLEQMLKNAVIEAI